MFIFVSYNQHISLMNTQKSHLATPRSKRWLLIGALLCFAACATISTFSQHAYLQTTSLKVEALALMDKANAPYDTHADAVEKLTMDLQKLYEYEKNRPKNSISVSLWDKLLHEDVLLGGFLKEWKTKGSLNPYYIQEVKLQVGEAFDKIAGLESKKIKSTN